MAKCKAVSKHLHIFQCVAQALIIISIQMNNEQQAQLSLG